jgi:hypothetical protein
MSSRHVVPTSIPNDYSAFYKGQIPIEIRVKQSERVCHNLSTNFIFHFSDISLGNVYKME